MPNEVHDYLAHHGIKGQKWGVRRFQNEDGSLTEEGKRIRRYAPDRPTYKENFIRKTLGGDFGAQAYANYKERKFKQKFEDAKTEDEKEKFRSKYEAQAAANSNMELYRKHTSTLTLIAQNALAPIAGRKFRKARARGENFMNSFFETSVFFPLDYINAIPKNKKAYGKYIVYSDM